MTGLWWIIGVWRHDGGYRLTLQDERGGSGGENDGNFVGKLCTDMRVKPILEAHLSEEVRGFTRIPIVVEKAGVEEITSAYIPDDIPYPKKERLEAKAVLES